jgi:hypothetical protein
MNYTVFVKILANAWFYKTFGFLLTLLQLTCAYTIYANNYK